MKITHRVREALTGYGFISIWIIGFLTFTLIPIFRTAFLSFNQVKITTEGIRTTFVAFKNYQDAILSDIVFVDYLLSYVSELVIYVPIVIVFSLSMALLLNMKIKMKGVFRTVFFLPVIITSGPVIENLINKGTTSLPSINRFLERNQVLELLPAFFASLITRVLSSFIIILWFSGVQILIFIAGLQKMDSAVYEAASIDGASRWESFWTITLPALNPMIMLNIIYTIITISMFSLNKVIAYIQSRTFDVNYGLGYASALSWIYFFVLLIGLIFFILVVKPREKRVKYS